jgi:hypothetical protein
MNPLLKYGLIIGAAYFLFRDQLAVMLPSLFGAHAPSPHPDQATTSATSSAPPPAPATGQTPTSAATTKDLLLKWAQANAFYHQQNGLMNAWQWGYGYNAVRGGNTDFASQFADPSRLMTLDEFWTGVQAAGLSGLAAPRRSAAARAWSY